jgi:hypothetical protein
MNTEQLPRLKLSKKVYRLESYVINITPYIRKLTNGLISGTYNPIFLSLLIAHECNVDLIILEEPPRNGTLGKEQYKNQRICIHDMNIELLKKYT